MLTARVGSPGDPVKLNRVLRRRLIYGEGELLTYTLGPDLDRLLSPEDCQVGAPRLARRRRSARCPYPGGRLILKVTVDAASTSVRQLSLTAWLPGRPDFVDLGPEASSAGSTLIFKISPRWLLYNGSYLRHPRERHNRSTSMGSCCCKRNERERSWLPARSWSRVRPFGPLQPGLGKREAAGYRSAPRPEGQSS
jgi:hypothetical protein